MAWWIGLTCIELLWVLAAPWLLPPDWPQPARKTPPRPTPPLWRVLLTWAHFIYHTPVLLVFLFGGGGTLFTSTNRWWVLVEACLLGVFTVGLYGIVLTYGLASLER